MQITRPELERALEGMVRTHQWLMLATRLRHIDFLDEEMARLDTEVEERLRPFAGELARLDTIPGVRLRRCATAPPSAHSFP